MRQKLTSYEEDLQYFALIKQQVKRALQKMAFNIREGTSDQQLLYNAVFSNLTRFKLDEVVLYAYHFSWGANDLSVLKYDATDSNVQACVDGIQAILINCQKDTNRSIIGLE